MSPSSGSEGSTVRAPYFFKDPVRLTAMVCAVLLMTVREVPLLLAFAAIAVSQVNGVAMVIDIIGSGWSQRWGRRARALVLTRCMTTDWTNLNVCTLVGAMLLMRLFGPPELTVVLGLLALGVALLPDIRVCRALFGPDEDSAYLRMERGWFFQDPIKLGGILALLVVCVLDATSLAFLFLSMGLMQINAMLLLLDKYLPEIPSGPARTTLGRVGGMLMAREGQRLWVMMWPVMLVPVRLAVDARVSLWIAAALVAVLVLPDLVRIGGLLIARMTRRVNAAVTARRVPRFRVTEA